MSDPILKKTDEFTTGAQGEVRTMQVWLQAVLTGELRLADKVLRTGLRAEHYRSLLPNDLNEATLDQRATLDALTKAQDAAVREFESRDAGKQKERDEVLRREGD